MLAFLLAKPTQFDAPFFRGLQIHRKDLPFVVYYWNPITPAAGKPADAAGIDSETGASLRWGIDLLGGYSWFRAEPEKPGAFEEMLRKQGISYLVCNGWKGGFGPLVKAAQHLGIPLGLRIDGVLWDKSPIEMTVRRIYLKKMYRPFSHFFSSGNICDEYLSAIGVPREKWKRWPYCVDASFFIRNNESLQEAIQLRRQYKLDNRPVILGVCKWVERENPLELLKAFIQLNDAGLQLVMIGDGLLRPQMEAVKALAPQLSITFTGYIPYAELPAWYALTRVFVHPAQYEPWGVSVHEAIAAGCAVVASNRVGSGFDLVMEGRNGFQYALGDTGKLASCIQKAANLSPDEVEKANHEILATWNYEAIYKQFEGLAG